MFCCLIRYCKVDAMFGLFGRGGIWAGIIHTRRRQNCGRENVLVVFGTDMFSKQYL